MTNKTIDIESLPLTERLTVGRQLAASKGKPVLFNGCVVTNNKSAKSQADALAAMPPAYRLAMARAGHSKPKAVAEEYAPAGGFVAGVGFVLFDEND